MDRQIIHKIAEILENDGAVLGNWRKLAHTLGVSEAKIRELQLGLNTGRTTPYELMYDILDFHKSNCRDDGQAQLRPLIETLKKNTFVQAAECVEEVVTLTEETKAGTPSPSVQPEVIRPGNSRTSLGPGSPEMVNLLLGTIKYINREEQTLGEGLSLLAQAMHVSMNEK